MKRIMKATLIGIIFCGILLIAMIGCEKDPIESIEFLVELVNENNKVIDTFEKGDSVLFKFYLTNKMGRELIYERPDAAFFDFLETYKQNHKGNYEYIGAPRVLMTGTLYLDTINDNEVKYLGAIPVTGEFNWPEMDQGNYYVGDTFKITIEGERNYFESRIYFTIE